MKMKNWSFAFLLAASFATSAFADETKTEPLPNEIPTAEKAFVSVINKYNQAAIIAQLGEPAKADDIKLKNSGKIVASIWQYHNINTAEDGSYYQTTELDFIEGKVVQVVFLNNDGSEGADKGQTYDLPPGVPAM
jgi:hypothetical protein